MTFIGQHHDPIAEDADREEEAASVNLDTADPDTADPDTADPDVAGSDTDDSDAAVEAPSTHALFEGDEGGLDLEERRALVVLLKNRFITSESHPREWRAINVSRQRIAGRLNDLFLELVISPEREVAFKRPVGGSGEFPTLLHDTAWQREETALLVFLRVRSRSEQARGEVHARVSHAELVEYLRENRPDSATNRVADDRRANRAIEALKSAGLLVKTVEDGVFRISPAIEPMLPVTALNNLLTWLNLRTAAGADDDEAAPSEPASTDAAQTEQVPTAEEPE